MPSEKNIYSLYKINNQAYLLRTIEPSCSNASQTEEDNAVAAEHEMRERMLHKIREKYHNHDESTFEFIGEQQTFPIGEALYGSFSGIELKIYYMHTEFGHPWIILGNANSEEEFLAELQDDEDLLRLNPIGKAQRVQVLFYTENDTQLMKS